MFSEGEEMYLQGKRSEMPRAHCAGGEIGHGAAGSWHCPPTHTHGLWSLFGRITTEGVSKPE